eukprot:Mycagemm_TRINITY_DN10058_c0_g1::TRINITY_DN10058_c0_g1_i1::g.2221::m.2221 type:complete len:163 gc:universal TRINITY_DN10058_c0_g1_i1:804-316(-)
MVARAASGNAPQAVAFRIRSLRPPPSPPLAFLAFSIGASDGVGAATAAAGNATVWRFLFALAVNDPFRRAPIRPTRCIGITWSPSSSSSSSSSPSCGDMNSAESSSKLSSSIMLSGSPYSSHCMPASGPPLTLEFDFPSPTCNISCATPDPPLPPRPPPLPP